MSKRTKLYVADFETTVYDGQTETEVWSASLCEVGKLSPDDVLVWNNINDFFEHIFKEKSNTKVWFHNLAFDGSFILNWLLRNDKFKQALFKTGDSVVWLPEKEMMNNTFKYVISEMGQWYTIIIKTNSKFVYIQDSLKLLPFSVSAIGEAFQTKARKLTMEYTGFRKAYGYISEDEMAYIKNDVLVMSEALSTMFAQGHNSMTIGSCCLKDYRKKVTQLWFKEWFPDLREIDVPKELQTKYVKNADDFIRKSYKGGWCYIVKERSNQIIQNGLTADVNSLYPSVMHSVSGNRYPVGKPYFWVGNEIPDDENGELYYFIKVKTEFKLKDGYLPCIQIKDSPFYKGTEWLTTSDIYNPRSKKYFNTYLDLDGIEKPSQVTLTLTCTDWKLINEHYELYNTEIIGGCYFQTELGLFDSYIDEWRTVKENSKGAMRTLAKLFLNNLYGKLASSDDSSFKVAHLSDDGHLSFVPYEAHEKQTVSIACGSAVTSYARNFTIRTAQKNFHGTDKRGFIYADTDSIHCDLKPEELVGVEVSANEFLKWKLETSWDRAIFVRQKTYIEHVIAENLEPIETPYHNIVCAGMGKRCKELLNASFDGTQIETTSDEEAEFIKTKRVYEDFKVGLTIPSKLVAKNIKGGVLLMTTTYEMH